MSEAERLLAQIEAQVNAARVALADEHEGRFRMAVLLLATDAERLSLLVTHW